MGALINKAKKSFIGRIVIQNFSFLFYYLRHMIFSDKKIIKSQYRNLHGFEPNIDNPKRFTEKIQWLKLYNSNPLLTLCADKYRNRVFVKDRIGPDYLIPLIYSTDDPDCIPFKELPTEYIIKTNHASGYNIIVKNGKVFRSNEVVNFNKKKILRILKNWLRINFFYVNQEREYKDIRPMILIEELMQDESGNQVLNDYKIHCFDGIPIYIQTIFDRMGEVKENWFDCEWNALDLYYFSPVKKQLEKPSNLKSLLDIAKKLSQGFNYVRVDLYSVKNKIYFGELTFHPYSGLMKFTPDEWDFKLGELIKTT